MKRTLGAVIALTLAGGLLSGCAFDPYVVSHPKPDRITSFESTVDKNASDKEQVAAVVNDFYKHVIEMTINERSVGFFNNELNPLLEREMKKYGRSMQEADGLSQLSAKDRESFVKKMLSIYDFGYLMYVQDKTDVDEIRALFRNTPTFIINIKSEAGFKVDVPKAAVTIRKDGIAIVDMDKAIYTANDMETASRIPFAKLALKKDGSDWKVLPAFEFSKAYVDDQNNQAKESAIANDVEITDEWVEPLEITPIDEAVDLWKKRQQGSL